VAAQRAVDYRSSAPLPAKGRGAGPEALINAVCAIFFLTRDQLLARDRKYYKVEARCTLYHLLYRYGLSISAIALLVGRDHSTVHHQLVMHRPLDLTPDQQKMVSQCFFSYAASKTLGDIPPVTRQAITAYLYALCVHTPMGGTAYQGLVALSRYGEWRDHAYRFLRVLGELPQAYRIPVHARQAGLQWVGPVPSFPQVSLDISTGLKTANARQKKRGGSAHA
jgi:hypothetical protein